MNNEMNNDNMKNVLMMKENENEIMKINNEIINNDNEENNNNNDNINDEKW